MVTNYLNGQEVNCITTKGDFYVMRKNILSLIRTILEDYFSRKGEKVKCIQLKQVLNYP